MGKYIVKIGERVVVTISPPDSVGSSYDVNNALVFEDYQAAVAVLPLIKRATGDAGRVMKISSDKQHSGNLQIGD